MYILTLASLIVLLPLVHLQPSRIVGSSYSNSINKWLIGYVSRMYKFGKFKQILLCIKIHLNSALCIVSINSFNPFVDRCILLNGNAFSFKLDYWEQIYFIQKKKCNRQDIRYLPETIMKDAFTILWSQLINQKKNMVNVALFSEPSSVIFFWFLEIVPRSSKILLYSN